MHKLVVHKLQWNYCKFGLCGVLAVLTLVFIAGGCSSSKKDLIDSAQVHEDADTVWLACQIQLKSRGFKLDRVDRRHGIIETYPLVSRQWFEFWRNDVVDDGGLAESSLQTVRRRAKIDITPIDSEQWEIVCHIYVERLSLDPGVEDGAVRIEDIFFNTMGRQSIWSRSTIERFDPYWIDLGRDEFLESDIIQAIQETLRTGA